MKNIFTAQKTVLALAVAGLMSSGAFAAANEFTNLVVGADSSIAFVGTDTPTATGTVTGDYSDKTDQAFSNTNKDTVADSATVTLEGGSIDVSAKAPVTQPATAGADGAKTLGSVSGNGTINLSAINGKEAKDAFNATLTLTDGDLSGFNGTVAFTSTGTADKGIGVAKLAGVTTLGAVEQTQNGLITEPAKQVVFDVTAGTTAEVAAAEDSDLTFVNVAINNAGKLTFTAASGKSLLLNSALNLSSSTGVTIFAGESTISKDFTGSKVVMGKANADNEKNFNQIFTGDVTVKGGVFTAQDMTVAGNQLMVTAGGEFVVDGTMTITGGKSNEGEDAYNHQFNGTQSFKDVVIATTADSEGNAYVNVGKENAAETSFTADTLKISGVTDHGAGFWVNGGKVAIDSVEAGANGKFGTWGGETAINTLSVSGGEVEFGDGETKVGDITVNNGGETAISGGEVVLTGSLTVAEDDDSTTSVNEAGSFSMAGGTLTTAGANLLSYNETTKAVATVAGVKVTDGTIKLTDEVDYTITSYGKVRDALDSESKGVKLEFLNGKIWGETNGTLDKTKKVTWGEINDNANLTNLGKSDIELNHNYDVPDWEFTHSVTLGTLEAVYTGQTPDVTPTQYWISTSDGQSLTIHGGDDGKTVFIGFNAKGDDGNLLPIYLGENGQGIINLGEAGMGDSGVIDNKLQLGATTNVYGNFTVNNDVELTATGSALTVQKDAVFTVNNLKKTATGNLTNDPKVSGGVLALKGTAPVAPVGGQAAATAYSVSTAGVELGAAKLDDGTTQGAMLVLGGEYGQAAQAYRASHSDENVIWVAREVSVDSVKAAASNTLNALAIDVESLKATGYAAKNTAGDDRNIVTITNTTTVNRVDVLNLQSIDHSMLGYDDVNDVYQLQIGNLTINGDRGTKVDFGTDFYRNDLGVDEAGAAKLVVNEEEVLSVYQDGFLSAAQVEESLRNVTFNNQIANTIIFGARQMEADLNKAIFERAKAAGFWQEGVEFGDIDWENVGASLAPDADPVAFRQLADAVDSAFWNKVLADENTAMNLATMGGAFSVGFDINDQIRSTIDRRSSLANLNVARNATGITPWVDVMGTWNTADGLYGSSGYEADIYGATLGADYTASCGAILGAAISIGQADANSVDASTKVDNDVDFWGVSFYGSHRIGNVNGKFDIGYVSTSNDLSANAGYFGHVKESLDADIFTVGVGAEYLATVGSLNVVPHAGIRWSSLDMDDSKYGADYDKMNLFQMPIGVAFSGTFDMTGWKVAPMLDISVVPTFGDKDAVASYAGGIQDSVRVVDSNPVQMTLGVNATVDAWTLGVNYGLSAGSDERLNNAFNFNARYTF